MNILRFFRVEEISTNFVMANKKFNRKYLLFDNTIVNRGKWLGRAVKIKEANKRAEVYVGRPMTLHIFCFMLTDCTMHELHHCNTAIS